MKNKVNTEYKKCSHCGSENMVSDYHYKSEELYESCDVCGYYYSKILLNNIEDGNYPDNWNPEYKETKGVTGFVFKIFSFDLDGFSVCFCEKKDLEALIDSLENDESVDFFGVTFKGKNGSYKTQIFKQ